MDAICHWGRSHYLTKALRAWDGNGEEKRRMRSEEWREEVSFQRGTIAIKIKVGQLFLTALSTQGGIFPCSIDLRSPRHLDFTPKSLL